jgi:hypothetical protein
MIILILTALERGVTCDVEYGNRLNGFLIEPIADTGLKPGENET